MNKNRNKLLSIIVLISLFIQVNQIGVYYLLFEFNQNKIANTVCEKVVVHCDGKCFLKKQIARSSDEETKQTKSTSPLKTKIIELIGSDYVNKEVYFSNPSIHSSNNFQIRQTALLVSGYFNSIDPPPKA